jgi:hypothetical protein
MLLDTKDAATPAETGAQTTNHVVAAIQMFPKTTNAERALRHKFHQDSFWSANNERGLWSSYRVRTT